MSNNPFASALNEPDSYVHRRDPPPPPKNLASRTVPVRPPKPEQAPPPSYNEVNPHGSKEYPREKTSSSSSSRPHRSSHESRPHRSHSDSSRHHRSSGREGDRDRDRDRERRHRSSRNRSPTKKKSEPVKPKNLDTIDKLDVTGFFGGGFHHDGPFDACTPHRNKNQKSAPVMAFPADGPNNSISGLGPNRGRDEQMNLAFGNYDENDHNEIVNSRVGKKNGAAPSVAPSTSAPTNGSPDSVPLIKTSKHSDDPTSTLYTPKQNPSVINFDANKSSVPVHGSTTMGLGSSTFLDGAPAPRITNEEYLSTLTGGLGRKKSLVQRLRKNSLSEHLLRRNSNDNALGRSALPPSRPSYDEETSGGNSLLRRVKSLKVGGRR